jgi:hypothetical protein
LLDEGDPRSAHLQRACSDLVQWEDVYVEETADENDMPA